MEDFQEGSRIQAFAPNAVPETLVFGAKGSEVIYLNELVKTNEKQMILTAIESSPTKTEAARRLGISPRTLRYKMAQLRMAGTV